MLRVDRERLAWIARRNLGVFTRAQATECGYSSFQIRHRLTCGDWQPVLGSALAFAGLRTTPVIRDRAAQLLVSGSILAGPSAARVLRIDVPDERTFLYVGAHGRARLPGVVALHTTPDPNDVMVNRGLPSARAACALLECLLWLPERRAIDLLDRTLQLGWWTFDEFSNRVDQRRGRRGYRRLAAQRDLVAGGERAESERRLTKLLGDAGITGWRVNMPVYDADGLIGIGDLVFDRERLVVETDGWAYHSTPDRFERDRERQNRFTRAEWEIARFTWRQLTERPQYVVGDIRARLTRLRRSSDGTRSVAERSVG
jgi:very-short-patch-repair endonuclease